MNLPSMLLWGFTGTVVLTTVMAGSQRLGLSRISLPFMLGTMFTASRDRAMVLGFLLQVLNGWVFALGYGLVFHDWGLATWWLGGLLGIIHGSAALVILMPMLPGIHPRMASEAQGPDPTRALEPPGFLALNYGRRTPIITLLAHIIYGAILGGFYRFGA